MLKTTQQLEMKEQEATRLKQELTEGKSLIDKLQHEVKDECTGVREVQGEFFLCCHSWSNSSGHSLIANCSIAQHKQTS